MNSDKELVLVRLARDFSDLPESAVVEVVSTLAMLRTEAGSESLEDQARALLTKIRWSIRRRGALARFAKGGRMTDRTAGTV